MGSFASWIRRHPRRTIISVLLTIIIAALTYLAIAWPELRIAYHRRQMKADYEAVYSAPPKHQVDGLVGYEWGAAGEAYEYHRERLVELGGVIKLEHTFQHLRRGVDDSEIIWKPIWTRSCPPFVDATLPGAHLRASDPNAAMPLDLILWCDPEHVDAWRRFIAERDIPGRPVAPSETK